MKLFITCFIFLFSINSYAQLELNREYCTSLKNIHSGYCINLENFESFSMRQWNYTGYNQKGRGIYEIKEDTLVLHFDLNDVSKNEIIVKDSSLSNKDSIEISIKILDSQKNKISYADVVVSSKEKMTFKEIENSFSSNENGVVSFKLPNEENEAWITIFYVGSHYTQIKFNKRYNYSLNATIFFDNLNQFNYDTYYFLIGKKRKNSIFMRCVNFGNKWDELSFE